ncbi:hypothetical protein IF2G_07307 [Cordyceps javanica]|nr:hypothetical protein IF2G_07307 [Cordyceps javanica]
MTGEKPAIIQTLFLAGVHTMLPDEVLLFPRPFVHLPIRESFNVKVYQTRTRAIQGQGTAGYSGSFPLRQDFSVLSRDTEHDMSLFPLG